MQFVQKALAEALAKIGPFVSRRSALPVLKGVRIQPQGDNLVSLDATDLESGAIVTCEAIGTLGGSFVANYTALKTAVAGFKADPRVEVLASGDLVMVGNGKRSTFAESYTLVDFPEVPEGGPEITTVVAHGADLGEILTRVAVAASGDQARPILTSICVDPDPDNDDVVDLVATDSYRLAAYRGSVTAKLAEDRAGKRQQVLWPASATVKAAKLCGQALSIHITDGRTWFGGEGVVAWARHIDGAFPKWRSLFPDKKAPKTTWYFDRQDAGMVGLAAAAKADKGHLPVRLEIETDGDTRVRIQKGGTDVYSTLVGGRTIGDALTVAFNPTYLAQGLAVLHGAETKMDAIDALKPVVFTGDDELDYLLMAVRT